MSKLTAFIDRNNRWLYPTAVAVLAFLVFLPALGNLLVNTDDQKYLLFNPAVTHWPKGIITVFTSMHYGLYKPLVLSSFGLEHALFGLNPLVFHLDNMLLHTANAALVFLLFRKLFGKDWPAFFTAALFACHPMHVESVAWVSERKDVLASFFFLSAMLTYERHAEGGGKRWLFFSWGLFICSLASKPMGISMPFVLLAWDYARGRELTRQLICSKLFYLAAAAAIIGLSFIGLHEAQSIFPAQLKLWQRAQLVYYETAVYLIRIFAPVNLSAHYDWPALVNGELPARFAAAQLAVPAALLAGLWLWRRSRIAIFGLLFFVFTLAPALQWVPTSGIHSDRYSYLPYLGPFCILAWYTARLAEKGVAARRLVVIASCAAVVTLSALTWQRCKVWRDSETLWLNALTQNPNSVFAWTELADFYALTGQCAQASAAYAALLEKYPGSDLESFEERYSTRAGNCAARAP